MTRVNDSLSDQTSRDPAGTGSVVIICPGALENGGGIGRQMGYFLQADPGKQSGLSYRVVDSRGPWFLGASRMHMGLSVFYLASAVVKVVVARFGPVPCLFHVNITGRGSTVRKAVLLTFARMVGARYLLHVHDPDYADEYRRRGPFMQSVIAGMFRSAIKVLVL